MRESFGEDEKEQLKKVDKKRKKEMRDNLEEEQEYSKKEDSKRKKAKYDNLDDYQKDQLRQYEKGVKKVVCVNFADDKKSI